MKQSNVGLFHFNVEARANVKNTLYTQLVNIISGFHTLVFMSEV